MESSKPTLCHPLLQFLHQTGASLGSVKGAQRIPPPPLGLHPPPVLLASFKAHTAQKGHLYHERRLFFPLLQSSGWQKLNTNILGFFFLVRIPWLYMQSRKTQKLEKNWLFLRNRYFLCGKGCAVSLFPSHRDVQHFPKRSQTS